MHFLLSQLSSAADQPSTYDDLVDPDPSKEGGEVVPNSVIKQKLLHIITDLNTTLYGTHAVIRSNLELFGPSLPSSLSSNSSVSQWLAFFEKFLHTPLRFKQDPLGEVHIRKRALRSTMR